MTPHRHFHQLSTGAKIGGILMVLFAGVIITIEVMLHVMAASHDRSYSINYVMLLIGLITGFTGMYILSPPRAKDGGQFIVNNAIKIIQVMKAGRRKGDPIAAIVEDVNGNTATMVIPAPTETEVPIKSANESGPNRRMTDPANGVEPHNPGGPGA
jgi:hypothetical protein